MISVTEDIVRLEQWLYVIPLRLRSLFRRDQVERELDEELRFHLERETADNIARGLKPSEARRKANRSLTDIESRKEECRDMRHLNIVDNFIQDLRYALRSLRKNPGFAALAVLVGALGIGANTAVFSVVNAVLLKPLPFHDPNHIVTLTSVWRNTGKRLPLVTLPDFIDWRANSTAFSSMAYFRKSQRPVVLGGSAHYARVARVSPEFFRVLAVTPSMGRMFAASDTEGQRNIAVISHAYWLNRLNASQRHTGNHAPGGRPSVPGHWCRAGWVFVSRCDGDLAILRRGQSRELGAAIQFDSSGDRSYETRCHSGSGASASEQHFRTPGATVSEL